SFLIDCPGQTSLRVITATSGPDPDPDGYILTFSDTWSDTLSSTGEFDQNSIPDGSYFLRLTSVAGNCTVDGGATRSITLQDQVPATVTFTVTCIPRLAFTPGEKLILSAQATGDQGYDLYLLDPVTGALQRQTDDPGSEVSPSFSPDGKRVLYFSSSMGLRLQVLDLATGKETVLPPLGVTGAAWSPDGARIAFIRNGQIWIMAADGTGETLLQSAIA